MRNQFFLLIFFLLIFFANPVKSQEVTWYSFEEALELNKQEPRKIMVDLYTNWCGWCTKMDKLTFSHPEVARYLNKYYYPVKLNAETRDTIKYFNRLWVNNSTGRRPTHQLAYAIGVYKKRLSYPTIVFMNEENKVITPWPGFQKPEDLLPLLHYFANDIYLSRRNFYEWKKNYQQNGKKD